MEDFLSNSFDLYKKNISTSELLQFDNNFEYKYSRSNSFTKKINLDLSDDSSTEHSNKLIKIKKGKFHSLNKNLPKNQLFNKNKITKDIYGNIIEKGKKYKVSFKDDIKGNYLVEMTLIDTKQNSYKSRYYKNQTIFRESRDKEEIICSGLCNIY